MGGIPRLVFGYFQYDYVFRRKMRRAGVVAPGGHGGLGTPTREIRSTNSFDLKKSGYSGGQTMQSPLDLLRPRRETLGGSRVFWGFLGWCLEVGTHSADLGTRRDIGSISTRFERH